MAKTKIDCSKKFSVLNSFLHENCSTWSLTSLNISCLIKYKFEINLDGVCPFSFHFSSFLHVYSSCPSLPATSSLTTFEEKKTKTEGKQNKREKTKLTLWSLFNKQSVSYFASFSNHVNVGWRWSGGSKRERIFGARNFSDSYRTCYLLRRKNVLILHFAAFLLLIRMAAHAYTLLKFS